MNLADSIGAATDRICRSRDALLDAARRGGFSSPESYEAQALRRAAIDILATINRLEANTPADLRKDAA